MYCTFKHPHHPLTHTLPTPPTHTPDGSPIRQVGGFGHLPLSLVYLSNGSHQLPPVAGLSHSHLREGDLKYLLYRNKKALGEKTADGYTYVGLYIH